MTFNLFDEIDKQNKKYGKPTPCNCKAYDFPHRRDGGKCNITNEEEFSEPNDSRAWWQIDMDDSGHKPGDFG